MVRLALLFGLVVAPAGPPAPCPPPERVFLGALATDVMTYLNRRIEVCGIVQGAEQYRPNERILHDSSPYGAYWFYVDDSRALLPEAGERGCVVGITRRRDGLTPEQAIARGLSNSYVADGLQRPDFVLYPVSYRREPAR